MPSDPLQDGIRTVDTGSESGSGKANNLHSGDSEKLQGVRDESTTTKTRNDTEVDVSLPLNWSTKKKFLNMVVPSFICFVV
jgi:hypothetical protein